jgi:hypothetical protein
VIGAAIMVGRIATGGRQGPSREPMRFRSPPLLLTTAACGGFDNQIRIDAEDIHVDPVAPNAFGEIIGVVSVLQPCDGGRLLLAMYFARAARR